MNRPDYTTSPEYYHYYFDLSFGQSDLLDALKTNCEGIVQFFQSIPEDKWHYRYAEDKWTIAEVLMHLIETERIFAYRALAFSRFDETDLPGYDENKYIDNAAMINRSYPTLLTEFISLRTATFLMFSGFTDEMLDFKGKANNYSTTAKGLGWFLIGHTMHHVKIVNERYL